MIKAPRFPFRFNDNKGYENNPSNKETIKFHLTNLFMTSPGERISDRDYGIGIRRFLFEPNVSAITGNIKVLIEDKIREYIPYIEVVNLNVVSFEEENSLGISLRYKILKTAEMDVISFEISSPDLMSSPSYWGKKYAKKTIYWLY